MNAEDSTRIVVTLDDTIKYDSVRIASPDRIYFDLYKAKLGAKLPAKPIDVQTGLLKSVRVAQNKPTVVRLVLDVDGAKDYSAYLLAKPYRLVIDVHAKPVATAANAAGTRPVAVAKAEPATVSKVSARETGHQFASGGQRNNHREFLKERTVAQPSATTAAKVAADVRPSRSRRRSSLQASLR